ncbi:DPP IV N-terminal domain-containing protein, partial [Psychrobacter sp. 1Y1]|uniref:DPP IV N-terminal domain-containing protein n=1 Tax=Psychrobacter sp. 1Y1 TaxID=3453574 RepID=UPI003F4865EC
VAIDDIKNDKELVNERSEAWVNLNDDLHFLKQQDAFIWASERDGFNHLYLIGLDGKVIRQLTSGDWAVDAVEYVDEKAGDIYFTGRKTKVTEKQLYRVALSGGKVESISQRSGMHEAVFADNKPVYLDYFSSLSQPPQVSLHDRSGERLAWVEQNEVKKGHPLYNYFGLWQVPEFGELK